jgi:putative peptidoglycan lipid II flippase
VSRLARAAGAVSAATLVSRILGLFRDAVRGALVGAHRLSDALDVAFKVPNLLRDLFAEGAFSGAFVPTLTRVREHDGDDAAFALLNRVLSTMIVHVGAIVVLIVAFAPGIVDLLAPTFARERQVYELTIVLVRLLAPFLLFVSMSAAAMGTLNVHGRFFVPALSPAMQNVVLVLGGVVLVQVVSGPSFAVVPWAVLLLCGGAMQFVVQVPALVRLGWRPRFTPDVLLRATETRTILRRMLPVAGGVAAAHVCVLINTRLATGDAGGTSNLYYAFRLVHLPIGVVGVALGTVVLAEASRRAARGDREGVRDTLSRALFGSFALCAPAAAGLAALGEPIARLLFEWVALKTHEAVRIGETIRYYSVAVVFFAGVKVVAPVFYARGQVTVPLLASLAAVAANLATALTLHPILRWNGLALAVGVGQAANLGVLLWVARGEYGGPAAGWAGRLFKILLAALACGAVARVVWGFMPTGTGFGARLVAAGVPIVAGAAAYYVAGISVRSPDIAGVTPSAWLDRTRKRP